MTSRNQLKHFLSLCSSFQCCTLGATAEGEAGTGAAFRGWAAGFAGSASEGAGSAGGAAEGAAQGRDREPAGPTERRAGGAAIRTAGAGKRVSGCGLVLRLICTCSMVHNRTIHAGVCVCVTVDSIELFLWSLIVWISAPDRGDTWRAWDFLDGDRDGSQWYTGYSAGGACQDCEE